MREIAIISKSTPAKPRSGNYNSLATSSAGAGGAAQIDFSALFAAEMARWFARDEESHAIYPVDYQEEAVGFYSKSFISAYGKNPESGGEVSGVTALSELTDVTLTDLQSGQALVWNGTRWVNRLIETGLDEVALTEYLSAHGYVTSTVLTQALGGKADKTVQVVAGDGLTGGGTLSANVTLGLAEVGEAGTYAKVTVDVYGRVTGHQSLEASDIPALEISKITGLQSALDAKLEKSVFEDLFEKVALEGGGYAIRAKYALFSNSWLSALGENPDAGGIGGSGTLEGLSDVALGALSDGQALVWSVSAGKWVNGTVSAGVTDLAGLTDLGEGWLDVLQGTKPTTLAGYGITDVYTKTEAEGRYVKKSGDTMSNSSAPQLKINGTTQSYITFTLNNTIRGHVGFIDTVGTFLQNGTNFLQIDNNGGLNYNNGTSHPLLHAGNYTTYTVTKTGGGASGTWPISISGSAYSVTNLGRKTAIGGTTLGEWGLKLYEVYNNGYPVAYGNVINIGGNGYGELLCGWSGTGAVEHLYYRSKRDVASTAWTAWSTIIDSSNYPSILDGRYVNVSGDTMTGLLTANGGISITTDSLLQWARNTDYAQIGFKNTGDSDTDSYMYFKMGDNGNEYFKWQQVSGSTTTDLMTLKSDALRFKGNVVWHAGNDGSGSGLDADLLDGLQASWFYQEGYVMAYRRIDASRLDQNTWYPVTFNLFATYNVRIECRVALNSGTKPSWSTHVNGFSVRKIWEVNGSGWGTNPVNRRVLVSDYAFASTDPVRGIDQNTNSSLEYVYVRGGGVYYFYLSHNIGATLHTSSYTHNNITIAPTTTAPAVISRNVAYVSDNVASATKLQTARTIWGQSFNGTANVSGNMTGVGSITGSGSISMSGSITAGAYVYSSGWFQNNKSACGLYNSAVDARWYANGSGWISDKKINATAGLGVSGTTTLGAAVQVPYSGSAWIGMATRTNLIYSTTNNSTSAAHALYRVKANNGNALCFGGLGNELGFYAFTAANISSGTNAVWKNTYWDMTNWTLHHGGVLHCTGGIYSDSYVSAKGNNSSSDIRLKNILCHIRPSIEAFAQAPLFKFAWKSNPDMVEIGSSAQYWRNVLPDTVKERDGWLEMGYGNIALAGVITIARDFETLEQRVDRLEKENGKLKKKVKELERRTRE